MTVKLLLVGCGKMGGALLSGWIDRGVEASSIAVVEPEPAGVPGELLATDLTVTASPDALAPDLEPEVVVFAVKPQAMDPVLPAYARFASARPVFLSIAAGRTIASIEATLGAEVAIVRAMPNTPAAIRRGISVAVPNERVEGRGRDLCDSLLAAVGDVVWVDDESLMDAVTAVSGSGPAYVFLLVEALAEAGTESGLSADLAERLARETVIGAAALLSHSEQRAETLRRNVTSPGGTTEAALQVLLAKRDGLGPLLRDAVRAAARRSRELAR